METLTILMPADFFFVNLTDFSVYGNKIDWHQNG